MQIHVHPHHADHKMNETITYHKVVIFSCVVESKLMCDNYEVRVKCCLTTTPHIEHDKEKLSSFEDRFLSELTYRSGKPFLAGLRGGPLIDDNVTDRPP